MDPTMATADAGNPLANLPPEGIAEAFEALDAATAAISAERSLDRVLQLIVDRVRPLVAARYAAIGIVDDEGVIERFITSGMSPEVRAGIGAPPRGRGLLGLIIREGRSYLIRDVMSDPRRSGFPPNHPPMHSFLGVPIRVEGRSVGNLYLTEKAGLPEFSEGDQRLVETFARHAGIAIHNARLHDQVQRLAVVHERERIGRDLHDGIIQDLYAVSLSLEDIGEAIRNEPSEAEARVDRAVDSIQAAIRDIRKFIFGLRPEDLDGSDLIGALTALAEEFGHSTLVDVDLDLAPMAALDAESTVEVLQLAREALSNVARHAGATRVAVTLRVGGGRLALSVVDDGAGFDPSVEAGPGHRGLSNMRARAGALGGGVRVESSVGEGTRVRFEIPIGSPETNAGADA